METALVILLILVLVLQIILHIRVSWLRKDHYSDMALVLKYMKANDNDMREVNTKISQITLKE